MGKQTVDIRLLFERVRLQQGSFRAQLRRSFIHLSTGGEWARAEPPATRRNLVWFWLDGFFAAASDNIIATYLVVFLLALGATQGQVGLLSALSSLSAALLLMPGALLVERIGRRRGIVLVGGGWARVALLLLALAPLALSGSPLIWFAIALAVSRDALANLSFPAWMALTADIVPLAGRGRYFASRNFIMAITGMAATFLIGLLITYLSGNTGYQVALLIAFILGSLAVYAFSRIADPRPTQPRAPAALPSAETAIAPQIAAPPSAAEIADTPQPAIPAPAAETAITSEITVPPSAAETFIPSEPTPPAPPFTVHRPAVHRSLFTVHFLTAPWLRDLLAQREFVQFAAVTAFWNLSLNIAGPFFNVYLVQNLAANPTMIGLTSIASSVAGMLIQTRLGALHDRWGARRLTVFSGLLIPLVPLAWAFIDSVWYVIPINLASGALWGAYSMASFNYLLQITPPDRRARYSAIFQTVVTLSLAAGAGLGSLVIDRWGFAAVFGGSAAGRLLAALLFLYFSARLRKK